MHKVLMFCTVQVHNFVAPFVEKRYMYWRYKEYDILNLDLRKK